MRRHKGLLLLVVALIIGGLVFLYFSHSARNSERQPGLQKEAKKEAKSDVKNLAEGPAQTQDTAVQSPGAPPSQGKAAEVSVNKVIESQTMNVEEDECQKMQKDLMEFFAYLDKQDYVKELKSNDDTFTRFEKIVRLLSSNPPTPAGEGLKYETIISNIYHIYRVLDLRDLRLILLILEHESDTMEVNLSQFYNWLMSSEKCNYKKGFPPSLDTLYRYAGFLVNSIGGRACLFRRETRLRLLVSYYCLLIINEADKRKMNSFGIDITPFLEPLAEEIENCQLLYFRKEYAGRLIDLKNYYLKKRRIS